MEAQARAAGLARSDLRRGQPAAVGSGELKLVAVADGLFGPQDGGELRHFQVADTHQLVQDLLAFGLKLHFVRQRLPSAATANAEMLAERFKPVFGRFYNPFDKTFHIIFLFPVHLDIDNVSGHGKIYEYDHTVHVCERFSLGSDRFNRDILQKEIYFLLGHDCQFSLPCKGRGNFRYSQLNII